MADAGAVERNHAAARAVGRPDQEGVAEAFGTHQITSLPEALSTTDTSNNFGEVPGVTDNTASLSWGGAGAVTATPIKPVEPSGHGQQRNENESHNMAEISKYPIYGGSR
jgi:hypothetical protein